MIDTLLQAAKPALVPAFSLLDQAGRPFTEANLRGHVHVVDFIFTRCPTVCPLMTAQMRTLARQAAAQGLDLRFASFSVDPGYDSPPRLRAYAEANQIDLGRWSLVTGDADALEAAVTDGFHVMMGRAPDAGEDDFMSIFHGDHFVLVDAQAQIRGYYTVVNDPQGRELLLHDAESLLRTGG